MKSRFAALTIMIILGVFLSVAVTAGTVRSQVPADQAARWEHLALAVDRADGSDADTSRRIMQLGNEGWELVAVATTVREGTTTKWVYCFKRPR